MNIQNVTDKNKWESYFTSFKSNTFLQSWEWGELQKDLKYEIERIALYKNDELYGIAQIIKIKAKRGNMLFVPHGPLVQKNYKEVLSYLKNYLIELAKKEKFDFIRISPLLEKNVENEKIYANVGFKKAPIYMHAETMWILPLDKSEDDLLTEMRKTTRYSIKKAMKDGVVIKKSDDTSSLELFWEVYEKTAQREHFTPFSKTFIKDEFEEFNKENNTFYFLGRLPEESQPVASALILFTKNGAFYHQGASLHTKIPVAYLLQWEIIKEAKKRGCTFYNFWGISPTDDPSHPWAGLSQFKKGFGGFQVDYLEAQDYKISPKYYISSLYERYLKWKRGMY